MNNQLSGAAYIADQIDAGILMGSPHFSVGPVQQSYDGDHCHVVLMIFTNQCGALIDALQRLAQLGLSIDSIHRLYGRYERCIEIDIIVNPRPRRKKSPFVQAANSDGSTEQF